MPESVTPRESLSKTPSWIMLGCVIGSIVTVTVQKHWLDKPTAAPAAETAKSSLQPTPAPPQVADPQISLATMENIFEQHRQHAVWRHDVTEVVYWNPTTNDYSVYVEILRNGEEFYFRTIPQLTRVVIEELNDPNVPIRFTEPESARAARRGGPFLRSSE